MKLLIHSLILFTWTLAVSAADLASEVVTELNFARTAPKQYAHIVASRLAGYRGVEGEKVVREAVRFLEKARPLPPLTMSEGICQSALSHVLDMGSSAGRGHRGSDGSQPWDRMARFGKWIGRAGENIDYGVRDARGIVVRLIVDDGVRNRGHRRNIFCCDFRTVGVAAGYHARYGAMCVIDFAGAFVEAPGRVALRPATPASPL